MNILDRVITWLAPQWGQQRARARMLARHYDSAAIGRRTDSWHRLGTDANAAAAGATLAFLRAQGRDLVRNNPWARRGVRRILSDTVGCGIRPKAVGRDADMIMKLWQSWAETTECDANGQLTFYAIENLVLRTIAVSGEVLVRRRFRLPTDGLTVPLQLQLLEPDYIDTNRDTGANVLPNGGEIIQGVEFDAIGRRVAYWLFDRHPGGLGRTINPISRRIPADQLLHIYEVERPGQIRGPSWFASVDVRLHDFADYEDATLVKQKFAACMAAFETDADGLGGPLGVGGTDAASGSPTDTIEPGTIIKLQPGKQITVPSPPTSNDHASYSATSLRGIAAGLGTTYSGLTGDYSQADYSSERAARLDHRGDVEVWQEHMLIPRLCQPVWSWFLTAVQLSSSATANIDAQPAEWTSPPMGIIDPEKEAKADIAEIRAGLASWAEKVRGRGYDPDKLLAEIAKYNQLLDDDEIVLDSDPRHTNAAGQQQAAPAAAQGQLGAGGGMGDGEDMGDTGDMEPKFAVGDRVMATVDHTPGMKGAVGTVAIANRGEPPYYGVRFDDQASMPGVHKWLVETELEAADSAGDSEMQDGAAH